jgi:hypothetical protein
MMALSCFLLLALVAHPTSLTLAGRRTVIVDGCNSGLRFATSPPRKGGRGKTGVRLLDCGGLHAQGAQDLVRPLVRWLERSDAFGVCVMDGKADLGRHAERTFRPDARLEVAFTGLNVTADDRMLALLAARGAACEAPARAELDAIALDTLDRLACAPDAWLQLDVRLLTTEQPCGALSSLVHGWARPDRHVYHLSTGCAAYGELVGALHAVAKGPATATLSIGRLRTSPVMCVTEDSRLRAACERGGALVVSPRVLYAMIGTGPSS